MQILFIPWKVNFARNYCANNLPTQVTPFPVYPELHPQVKLPGLFEQMAVAAQLSSSSAHSSMSKSICWKMVSSKLASRELRNFQKSKFDKDLIISRKLQIQLVRLPFKKIAQLFNVNIHVSTPWHLVYSTIHMQTSPVSCGFML